MEYRMMVVFAVSLTVAMVTVDGIGDVCYEACIETEKQQQECIKGCNHTGVSVAVNVTDCEVQCAITGSRCRLLCVDNFHSCKEQCKPAEPDIYDCLVTCLRDRYQQTLTTPAK